MSADGLGKRSFEVSHKNLRALHFRAYSLDLERQLQTARDYNLLPSPQEQVKIMNSQQPVAEWSADLPATPDYEIHRTFLVPPMKAPGCYVVAASVNREFSRAAGNRFVASNVILSDLVLLTTSTVRVVEVRTLAGERPTAGGRGCRPVSERLAKGNRRRTISSDREGRCASHSRSRRDRKRDATSPSTAGYTTTHGAVQGSSTR
jgi:hypothetical protein